MAESLRMLKWLRALVPVRPRPAAAPARGDDAGAADKPASAPVYIAPKRRDGRSERR